MKFDLNFPRASSLTRASGLIKEVEDDFFVEEIMTPELAGEGEHVWLWIEKIGQNTEYLAGKIAEFSNVKKMDVGFSGQKDRWAKTRQWFSVYLGAKAEPDWTSFNLENVRILKTSRHSKKLRRGEHSANFFKIVVKEINDAEELEAGLNQIKQHGFPNYYGPQRFGINGSNLDRGERYFEGEIKASRSQRSFYISAARSFLFNLNLAKEIEASTWEGGVDGGPLYGDPQEGVRPLNEMEESILASYPSLAKGIHKNRLKLDRRPFCIIPSEMTWSKEEGKLVLEFYLPTGIFATALLAELFDLTVGLGEG